MTEFIAIIGVNGAAWCVMSRDSSTLIHYDNDMTRMTHHRQKSDSDELVKCI
jgi:hypothetical protein